MNASLPTYAPTLALAAIRDRHFEPTEHVSACALKLCAMLLASHANEHGEAFPSKQTLAEELGYDERTARRACAELVRLGLLERRSPRVGRKAATYIVRVGWIGAPGLRKIAELAPVAPPREIVDPDVPIAAPAAAPAAASIPVAKPPRFALEIADPNAPDEALCVLMAAAYEQAREIRWKVGTEPIPPSLLGEPLRVAARVFRRTRCTVELACWAVATAYLGEPGRADGRLRELHHPISWFSYYATAVELSAVRLIRQRDRPERSAAAAESAEIVETMAAHTPERCREVMHAIRGVA